jgi:hypothetical protein
VKIAVPGLVEGDALEIAEPPPLPAAAASRAPGGATPSATPSGGSATATAK